LTVTVRGINAIQADLAKAAQNLAGMEAAHTQAAHIVVAASHPPRLTGRLAKSVQRMPGDGMVVGSGLPYARKIEMRTSFLQRAVTSTQAQWLAVYEAETARVASQVQGA
jgi:hypothetical protein